MTEHLRVNPKVVPYREALHRQPVLELLGNGTIKAKLWSWQFEENPFGLPFNPVIVEADGEIIGFNGMMPVLARYRGVTREILWSCDFIVAKSWRGKGIGRLIKTALISQSSIIMAFGISNRAAPVLLKMGWKTSQEVFHYRRFSTSGSFRESVLRGLQLLNRIRGLGVPTVQDIDVEVSDQLPGASAVDALCESVSLQYDKCILRNFAYLNWKYACHPLVPYRFIHLRRDGCLLAVGVIRKAGERARLVDYLGPIGEVGLKRCLIRAFLKEAKECAHWQCTTSDADLGSALKAEGFFQGRTRPRFFVRSSVPGDEGCQNGWFIMGGDSDGELLTAAMEANDGSTFQM